MVATNPVNIREILAELNEVTSEFLTAVSAFNQQQFNSVPFKGSWTAAQVVEHVFKSDYMLLKNLHGHSETSDRPIDENIDLLRDQFLSVSNKFDAPEEIIPDNTTYEKDTLLDALNYSRSRIREAIKTLDITAICHNPYLGNMTRYELLYFIIFHTRRHSRQLLKIFDALS